MASKKRNHFVPKWLLRRFACLDRKERDQIWLFRANGKPFRTHINNAGSGNYFYGDPNNGLEDMLAKLDDRDAAVLTTIEQTTDLAPYADAICRMVRLLLIRTRSLREKVTDTVSDLVAILEESATDPASEPFTRAYLATIVDDEVDKVWEQLPEVARQSMPKETIRAMIIESLKQLNLQTALSQTFRVIREEVRWDDAAARGHLSGLLKLLQQAESEPVPDGWRRLEWQTVRLPTRTLVLGDCAAFTVRGEGSAILTGTDAGKEPAGLCMPIAPDALLVGVVPGQRFPSDVATINDASVTHSFDSFFASEATGVAITLMGRLGASRGVLPAAQLQEIGRSAWRNLDKR